MAVVVKRKVCYACELLLQKCGGSCCAWHSAQAAYQLAIECEKVKEQRAEGWRTPAHRGKDDTSTTGAGERAGGGAIIRWALPAASAGSG